MEIYTLAQRDTWILKHLRRILKQTAMVRTRVHLDSKTTCTSLMIIRLIPILVLPSQEQTKLGVRQELQIEMIVQPTTHLMVSILQTVMKQLRAHMFSTHVKKIPT